MNYKIFSGRYIIYDTKEKIREYNCYNNKLIFEGEYLNGKRNGKGKEYDNKGNLIFEGEYLNGKRSIGKYYYPNIKIIKEMKNGKKFVNEYNNNNELIFEGEYLNGERNGKGKEYYNSEITSENIFGNSDYSDEYEKELIYSKDSKDEDYRDSLNTISSVSSDEEYIKLHLIFEGDYLNGKKWNGKGYDQNHNIIYELRNGKGYIREYDSYGCLLFEGEYSNGERNGKGKEYIREYGNDILLGLEEKEDFLRNKLFFDGIYLYNHKRRGRAYYKTGKIEYEGEYLFDKKWNGKGYDHKGNEVYILNDGNGKVKEYNKGQLIFEGEYLKGKKNGKGKD